MVLALKTSITVSLPAEEQVSDVPDTSLFSRYVAPMCLTKNQCKSLKSLVENKPQDDLKRFCSSHLNPPQN